MNKTNQDEKSNQLQTGEIRIKICDSDYDVFIYILLDFDSIQGNLSTPSADKFLEKTDTSNFMTGFLADSQMSSKILKEHSMSKTGETLKVTQYFFKMIFFL